MQGRGAFEKETIRSSMGISNSRISKYGVLRGTERANCTGRDFRIIRGAPMSHGWPRRELRRRCSWLSESWSAYDLLGVAQHGVIK